MLTHSSINGHLHSHLLATVNNAAMDMGIQISVQHSTLYSFEHICRSDSEASYFFLMADFFIFLFFNFMTQRDGTSREEGGGFRMGKHHIILFLMPS